MHAAQNISRGRFYGVLLAVAALSALPLWIVVDLARGRPSLMHAYHVLNGALRLALW